MGIGGWAAAACALHSACKCHLVIVGKAVAGVCAVLVYAVHYSACRLTSQSVAALVLRRLINTCTGPPSAYCTTARQNSRHLGGTEKVAAAGQQSCSGI